MKADFWHERWAKQQIGFHLDSVNPLLQSYYSQCFKKGEVFIPLCGKSLDISFFTHHHHSVIGVELSQTAIESFFQEQQLNFQRLPVEPFVHYQSNHLSLLVGDFFELTKEPLQSVHQVYDRASLIALPPTMRERYVEHLMQIMPRPFSIMLITLEYNQLEMNGPPFSVTRKEVESLYSQAACIQQLHYTDILDSEPHFKRKGLTSLSESLYFIEFN